MYIHQSLDVCVYTHTSAVIRVTPETVAWDIFFWIRDKAAKPPKIQDSPLL